MNRLDNMNMIVLATRMTTDNRVKIHRAPMTLEIIMDVKRLIRDNKMTMDEYRVVLNMYLPDPKRIEDSHSGIVKLNRWLNPSASAWQEPRSEIILAMQKTLANLCKNLVDNR
jgi:hypothetical protein